MACSQTLSGIAKDCATNKGGIVEVYLANTADVSAVTLTDNQVTAITMNSTAKFKKYAFAPQTAFLNSDYQISQENGTKYVQTQLQLVFNRMETTKRIEVMALAQAETIAIVKDANGVYWLVGKDYGLMLSAGNGATGTTRADRNGYTVTLQDDDDDLPIEVKVGTGGVDLSTIIA